MFENVWIVRNRILLQDLEFHNRIQNQSWEKEGSNMIIYEIGTLCDSTSWIRQFISILSVFYSSGTFSLFIKKIVFIVVGKNTNLLKIKALFGLDESDWKSISIASVLKREMYNQITNCFSYITHVKTLYR